MNKRLSVALKAHQRQRIKIPTRSGSNATPIFSVNV